MPDLDAAPLIDAPAPLLHPSLALYQLYDIGYAVDLAKAHTLLTGSNARRGILSARQSQPIDVPNPPVQIDLGEHVAEINRMGLQGKLTGRVYDLGICRCACTCRCQSWTGTRPPT